MQEFDSNGLSTKLVSWGHFENNIPIKQYYDVVIGESEPQKVKAGKPIFPPNHKEPTETVRAMTPEERKQRKIIF